jgi:hypothetical protein
LKKEENVVKRTFYEEKKAKEFACLKVTKRFAQYQQISEANDKRHFFPVYEKNAF